jgi:hypothetical protein
MKGGVQSMLHIGVKNGFVVYVYKLGTTPDEPVITLQEEFDYKVEYDETGVEPEIVKCKKGANCWLIPKLKKEA